MPATKVEPLKRKTLTSENYVSVNTRVHPDVTAAVEALADHEGVSMAQLYRETLTDAYNSGRFDLPVE